MVAVKRFPENTYFPEMLIFGKGKYFHVFGCISKNFPENIFWCLEKKKENTNPEKYKPQPRKNSNTVQILPLGSLAGAISRRRDRDQRRDLANDASRDRAARSTIAIVHRAARRRGAIVGRDRTARRRDRPSLSLIWAHSSLSLSLSLFPEVN